QPPHLFLSLRRLLRSSTLFPYTTLFRSNLSALLANSCTRFSPKRRNPAAYASRMRSGGCVLVTAMSAISSGLRPARLAAATRSRTRATFSAIDIDSLNHRGHGVTQRCQVFFFYWESTRARRPRHIFRRQTFYVT